MSIDTLGDLALVMILSVSPMILAEEILQDCDESTGLSHIAIAPVLPTNKSAIRALETDKQHVLLRFTLTTDGAIKSIEVIESSNVLFEASAIEAMGKQRYDKPVNNCTATLKFTYDLDRY